jgi:hypothetical protein
MQKSKQPTEEVRFHDLATALLDQFAIAALPAVMAKFNASPSEYANLTYDVATAMMVERNRRLSAQAASLQAV